MKIKHILASVATLVLIFFGLFYVLFDQYISSASNEAMMAWIKGEENSIIEGSLLSSMTKTQKVLLSSEFIKGLTVVDQTDVRLRSLVEFGERLDLTKIRLNESRIQNVGFFKKYIQLDVPNSPNLKIIFSIYSEKIKNLFWVTSSIFSFLTLLFGLIIFLLKKSEQKIIESYAQKAKQAAHDLAQPIVILNSMTHHFKDTNNDVLHSVIGRINNIVDDLSGKKSVAITSFGPDVDETLLKQIESLVEEKKLATNNKIKIELAAPLFLDDVFADKYEVLRVLSNFIQNSLEANASYIKICITEIADEVQFTVIDDGQGIPIEIINRIGEKGFTHGKKFGSGLGLFGALQFAAENNGRVIISSEQKQGAELTLVLPKKSKLKIILASDTKVFVLDDDELVLNTWKTKLNDLLLDRPVEYFKSASKLSEQIKKFDQNEIYIFSDYNLNNEANGLDFIESNGLQGQCALVTGQASDSKVIARAKLLKVPVIAKTDLACLRIELI